MDKPTSRWRSCVGNDLFFTYENIAEVDAALDAYLERLERLKGSTDQQAFELEIYDVIVALNQIGGCYGRHPDLIATMERDELAEFIEESAKMAGYVVHTDDITFDWRQW
jgi:hypothetical protein